jgi:glutamine synthetase
MFEEVNTAVDHNSLLMDVMDRVSSKHKLKVLFHEKPFAGINGSGKHNNWSMSTDLGKNLLTPGKTPRTNLQFLTFFINTIAAVNKHEALLRATVASHGNDHRLGANEAPPAIISIFIGSYLKDVLKIIEDRIDENSFDEQDNINLRLDLHNRIPDILKDNTDRNRTSPFAFTGNKFEIRAVGSSANCALPMTIINTIVADQLKIFKKDVDALIKEGDYKDVAILKVLRRQLKESKRIIFEGDNYGDEWHKEAEKRGLSNNKTTPEALEEFISEKSIKLFEDFNIYTKRESLARFEIMITNYTHNIQIEARVLSEIVLNQIVPAAVEYQSKLIKNILGIKEIGLKEAVYKAQSNLLETISNHIEKIIQLESNLKAEDKKASALEDVKKQAKAYCHKVKPLMDEIRIHCDELELFIDDDLWPLAKYREMLFSK